jgi:hypothetical protein
MAFITTNPNPFLINVPELQNVITSATGVNALANAITDLQTYINTANASANLNIIGSSSTGNITFTNNVNLSNASLTFLGSNLVTSNTINGVAGYLAFEVEGVEIARMTPTGFGVFTQTPTAALSIVGSAGISGSLGIAVPPTSGPLAPLDVGGAALVRGALYVSSMGAAVTSSLGYIYADGDIFANGINYPSDPTLKTAVRPLVLRGPLPEPVEFVWRTTGVRDIGVLADAVEACEPVCVKRGRDDTRTVDYPKLVVLLMAEVRDLKARLAVLEGRSTS